MGNGVPSVHVDLSALRFRGGALPMALADLHHSVAVGAPIALLAHAAEGEGRLHDLLVGAGFEGVEIEPRGLAVAATAYRARSLPDTVGPGMRLLVCGLNPSVYAADAGVGYARPSNRFWTAARRAGLVTRDRDPRAALRHDRVGLTDLVKRATPRAADLRPDEYTTGAARVRRLVEWLQPAAVCFVGLEGYRSAIDPDAVAGWQAARFGGQPAYLMPSTSGLNASSRPADFAAHLRAALHPPGLA